MQYQFSEGYNFRPSDELRVIYYKLKAKGKTATYIEHESKLLRTVTLWPPED